MLLAKYQLGLNEARPVDTNNLLNDLNAKTDNLNYEIAKNTLTLLRNETGAIPLFEAKKVAYVGIGATELNVFGQRLKDDWNADTFLFSYSDSIDKESVLLQQIQDGRYDAVVIGIHNFSLRPAKNYNISPAAETLWNQLQSFKSITFVFGNVYATQNFCSAKTLVACYQDDNITQDVAADLLNGKIQPVGKLPVSVCMFKYAYGIESTNIHSTGLSRNEKFYTIDSIVYDAIAKKAFPGCVVLAAKDGEIIYHKAFGNYRYEPSPSVNAESIYDLASVTKVSATTIAVMKLYEQGKLKLKKKLGDYLPWVRGTNKQNLVIEDILLHEAGLVPFIPFYKETIDTITGIPFPALYTESAQQGYIRVAENLYLRKDWNDTMFKRILQSPLGPPHKYVYSDNDFIFLGKVIEAISGMTT